ncbi:MAG: FAD-dependent monooxygenase [Proteobacteria bacterium]|nr:FAD-dependent monooxygenase [Pseudomonadota bacterium]
MMQNQQTATIIGGGHSGLTAAIMLAKLGINIVVLERSEYANKKNSHQEPSRLLALAKGSVDAYRKAGVANIAELGQSINHIRVYDRGSGAIIDYAPEEVGYDNFGYMLPERVLMQLLLESAAKYENIEIRYGVQPTKVEQQTHQVLVHYPEAKSLSAELLVLADGRNSKLAKRIGLESQECDYKQYGIVCDVAHEEDHCGVAVELCLPGGPFAILPKAGGYSSSLVWVEPVGIAEDVVRMAHDDIETLIAERFDGYLGRVKLVSQVKLFPLHMVTCRQYYSNRTALIGDTAHAIHPLAGQGFNLAMRDIIALAEQVQAQLDTGLDIGSLAMLQEYNNIRKFDTNLMIEATDSLNKILSSNFAPLKVLRGMGMRAINQIKPLKRKIIRYAMGL